VAKPPAAIRTPVMARNLQPWPLFLSDTLLHKGSADIRYNHKIRKDEKLYSVTQNITATGEVISHHAAKEKGIPEGRISVFPNPRDKLITKKKHGRFSYLLIKLFIQSKSV
jgi:hypothetical protein